MSNNSETDEFSFVPQFDWNFEGVPESELAACCLWEYARESPSVRLASQCEWCNTRGIWHREAYKQNPQLKTEHDEEAARIKRMVNAAGFDYGIFVDTFWANELALIEIYQSLKSYIRDGERPWQNLNNRARTSLANHVSQAVCLCPLGQAKVGELEELWNANRGRLDEIRSSPVALDPEIEEEEGWQESKPVNLKEGVALSPGSMPVAFTVDFTRFTDKEISDSFLDWLKTTRPAEWKRPKQVFLDAKRKGRKLIEFRVALERLGLMRLLHYYSPEEIREQLAPAWAKYGKKRNDFRREVREATKFFRKLFPFLPKTERPSSEARKGVWFPEMMAICDNVERDMGMT